MSAIAAKGVVFAMSAPERESMLKISKVQIKDLEYRIARGLTTAEDVDLLGAIVRQAKRDVQQEGGRR